MALTEFEAEALKILRGINAKLEVLTDNNPLRRMTASEIDRAASAKVTMHSLEEVAEACGIKNENGQDLGESLQKIGDEKRHAAERSNAQFKEAKDRFKAQIDEIKNRATEKVTA